MAQAHDRDLEIQDRHFCKALTYWYDEDRGTAFCLIEAPSESAVRDMHREAHGLIPNQVIEVDGSTVTKFLGRISDALRVGPPAVIATPNGGFPQPYSQKAESAGLK